MRLTQQFIPNRFKPRELQSFTNKKKKVRASVTGVGETKFEAESDLRKNVNLITFDSNFKIIRANTVGSVGNWTSTMVIEYYEER